MQLDIFNDSRDVMLRNDLLQALQRHDAAMAHVARIVLQREYADDAMLASAQVLLDAMQTHTLQALSPIPLVDHAALKAERLALLESVAPVAQRMFGQAAAALWLRPFWRTLLARAASLPFDGACEDDHVAPMRLFLQDWQGAADAVACIESWRRIPAPLAWMAQARLHALGLDVTWPLLVELAWLSPKRLDVLVQTSNNVLLQRLKDQFDACFEPDPDRSNATFDLAWFPAWVLTQRPQELVHLSQAQPGQYSAPEQAMRLLVNLLGLERQGRHHDIVAQRKNLRELNGWLFTSYMQTR
jgi:hypothetical protein